MFTIEHQLRYHLQHNHYPPVPVEMVPVCAQAIDACVAEEPFAEIELPESVTFRGRDTAPAWAIVEDHHLQPFVDSCFESDED